MLGWNFAADSGIATPKYGYADCRYVVPGRVDTTFYDRKGKLATKPILCSQGFHASRNVKDALRYASGLYLCRVDVSGELDVGSDKFAGTQRVCLYYLTPYETTRILARYYGRRDFRQLLNCNYNLANYYEEVKDEIKFFVPHGKAKYSFADYVEEFAYRNCAGGAVKIGS